MSERTFNVLSGVVFVLCGILMAMALWGCHRRRPQTYWPHDDDFQSEPAVRKPAPVIHA